MLVSRLKLQNLIRFISSLWLITLLEGCNAPVGTLYYGALSKGSPVLIVASAKTTANDGTNAVVAYDLSGNFLDQLADLTLPNQRPRGIAPFDPFNVIVALDGSAKILSKNSLFGSYSTFVGSSRITGNIYQIGLHETQMIYYAIIGNTIDAFDRSGNRISTSTSPVITTTTGACVLNSPRGLYVDAATNTLFVTNAGTTSLLVYDITTPTAPTCKTTNNTMGAVVPFGVLKHSNGYVYVTSAVLPATNVKLWALNGDGTGTATAVYTDATGTVLNVSTSIVELPDGSILIANSGTNQIDHFQVDGLGAATRVGTTPFIKDVFTTLINSMYVIKGL